jgi:hypothetical protein
MENNETFEMASDTDSVNNTIQSTDATDPPSRASAYKVGYRNAPKEFRFPPGASGNLRGRPRGRSKKTIAKALERTLSLNYGDLLEGTSLQTSIWEGLVRGLAHEGLKGNPDSARLLLQALESIANVAHRG